MMKVVVGCDSFKKSLISKGIYFKHYISWGGWIKVVCMIGGEFVDKKKSYLDVLQG